MITFEFRDSILHCEEVNLTDVAEQYGTPAYVYSKSGIVFAYERIDRAFAEVDHRICYALKANSNPALLALLVERGSGADVVSGGELRLALDAGFAPDKIVYASVGKTDAEIEFAIRQNIAALNVESQQELEVTAGIAATMGAAAPVALRLNPDIDIEGHPYITTGRNINKFGIELEKARECYLWAHAQKGLKLVGIHTHIGSMIATHTPFVKTAQLLLEFVEYVRDRGISLEHIDMGGGLGIDYGKVLASDGSPFSLAPETLAEAIVPIIKKAGCELYLEPGRSIMAPHGALLTKVLYTKEIKGKHFIIIDAGMNDLLRPALYGAQHAILPLRRKNGKQNRADVVGPICESGDFLAKDLLLPEVRRGDYLAVMTAGAYGYVLSSNYNQRPRPVELLVENRSVNVIRAREKL